MNLRKKQVFCLCIAGWIVTSATSLFGQSEDGLVYLPDSTKKVRSNLLGYVQRDWHLSISYGHSYLETQANIIRSYRNSGYPAIVSALQDPDKSLGDPTTVTVGLERNITQLLQVGFQYTRFYGETISGSNWIALEKPPENHLDISQKISSRSMNFGLRMLVLPLNIASRMELAAGVGLNFNTIALKGKQYFVRIPRGSVHSFDDTSSAYSFHGDSKGVYADLTFDFYWSKLISSQFKMERRFSTNITIPRQNFVYAIKRSGVKTYYTQQLNPQSADYSGFILSTSLRFHF